MNPQEPAGARTWIECLQLAGIDGAVDVSLAATLRIAASVRSNAVCLCSGPAVLPYVEWLRDGMPMTGRLIMHLDPQHAQLQSVLQTQMDNDIRVAGHFQKLQEFCTDIAKHRLDLLVLDLDRELANSIDALLALLNDNALVVILGSSTCYDDLVERFSEHYFFAPIGRTGSDVQATMMARKGMQHRQSRRSGRRRRNS